MSAPRPLPAITAQRARHLIATFPRQRVLVIGDVMLDHFLVGQVTRISPEAPVPVVTFDHDMYRVGGAANVAQCAGALGAAVRLTGVVGCDDDAARLATGCQSTGVTAALVPDAGRRTTRKVRIVTERNQQVARVDYETDHAVSDAIEETLLTQIRQWAEDVGSIVVSDYLKGCVTPRIVADVVAIGQRRGVPVLIDPKNPHIDYYGGATLITPNHHEAQAAVHLPVRSHAEAAVVAHRFRERARCAGVLMTRGAQGMWLLDGDTEGYLDAAAREVADVTGAGDTVIAVLGLALAAGATLPEAAALANQAAGIAVGKFGPASVAPAELLQAFGD